MRGHFRNHPCAHTQHGFRQQPFDVPLRVLDFIERTFNPFADTRQPAIKGFGVLLVLIDALDSPDPIAGMLVDLELPLLTDKAFIAIDRRTG